MSKIIILSRVSTAQQSLDAQTKELKQEATRLGYTEENQIVLEDVESAIKLSEEERIGLQKLKYHIEHDKDIDCVICWEPSRLSRRQTVLYSIRDYLLEHKIQLYILNPYVKLLNNDRTQIDTTASIVFSLFATISENEMTIKKERFMRAKKDMTAQGKKSAGSVIFGYRKNKDKYIELHPENSQIVMDIFNHYVDDHTASLYATYLWASSKWPSLFPVMPYKKSQRKIKHFFETVVYWEGNWCYPAFIPVELYERVKEKMNNSRCLPRFESKHNWLGRGRLYCKHCGKMLTPVAGSVQAYNCSTDKQSHNVTINVDAVEWLLWEEARVIANIKASYDNSTIIISTQKMIEEKKNLSIQFDGNIKAAEAKQKKLVGLYLDGNISKELFDTQNASIIEDMKLNQEKKDKTNAEIIELQNIVSKTQDDIKVKPANYDNVDNFETKLDIVSKTIDKVWVEKEENKVYRLEFEYKGVIVPQVGRYRYVAKNHYKRIYRINEDETIDLIYENCKPTKKDKNTGRFTK